MPRNIVYLFGGDVSASKSPQIHNSIYKYLNLDLEYKAVSLKDVNDIDKYSFVAANITYPFKKYFDDSNLIIEDKRYNFDGLGAKYFLERENILPVDNIVICGTGVTGHAIQREIGGTLLGRKTYMDNIDILNKADLIIDATPYDTVNSMLEHFHKDQIFMDVKYNKKNDYFNRSYGGTGMLVAQAVYSIIEICKYLDVPYDDFDILYEIGKRAILGG